MNQTRRASSKAGGYLPTELAKSPYQEALGFANSPNQKADAQISLARVNIVEQNWFKASQHLKAAPDNYLSINIRR